MKNVAGMLFRSSSRKIRSTPTTPNSPREIMLGEVAPYGPIQMEMASKSKVRQTVARGSDSPIAPSRPRRGTLRDRRPFRRSVRWPGGTPARHLTIGRRAVTWRDRQRAGSTLAEATIQSDHTPTLRLRARPALVGWRLYALACLLPLGFLVNTLVGPNVQRPFEPLMAVDFGAFYSGGMLVNEGRTRELGRM